MRVLASRWAARRAANHSIKLALTAPARHSRINALGALRRRRGPSWRQNAMTTPLSIMFRRIGLVTGAGLIAISASTFVSPVTMAAAPGTNAGQVPPDQSPLKKDQKKAPNNGQSQNGQSQNGQSHNPPLKPAPNGQAQYQPQGGQQNGKPTYQNNGQPQNGQQWGN